jgi:presenilin-like A22 family membrane protease
MVTVTMSSAASHPAHWDDPITPSGAVVITHPNRDKPVVQATRSTVVLLLLVSAGLVLVVTVGGWKVLEGAWVVQVGFIIVYLVLAFFAARWNRGVLPISAALAVLLLVFALVAGPSWFSRNKFGFEQPALNAGLLGVITFLIVPVQVLLIAFAMRGFQQGWNVELERPTAEPAGGEFGETYTPTQVHAEKRRD